MGIEPTPPAWKAGALPLSYARDVLPPLTTLHAKDTSRNDALTLNDTLTPALARLGMTTSPYVCSTSSCPRRPPSGSWQLLRWIARLTRHAVGEEGFEPSKAMPPDLQSGPFDRSGIPPVTAVTNFQLTDRPFVALRLPERSQNLNDHKLNGGLLERRSPESSRS
jgi:hypothetical protein